MQDDVAFLRGISPGKLAWVPCLAPASSEDVRNLIRLHFAKRDETLLEALNRLENIGKLKNKAMEIARRSTFSGGRFG